MERLKQLTDMLHTLK